jgi:hypothetical protein
MHSIDLPQHGAVLRWLLRLSIPARRRGGSKALLPKIRAHHRDPAWLPFSQLSIPVSVLSDAYRRPKEPGLVLSLSRMIGRILVLKAISSLEFHNSKLPVPGTISPPHSHPGVLVLVSVSAGRSVGRSFTHSPPLTSLTSTHLTHLHSPHSPHSPHSTHSLTH